MSMVSVRSPGSLLAGVSGALLLLLLALASAPSSVHADAFLWAVRPVVMKEDFKFKAQKGLMYSEPSLFGLPNYQAKVQAQLRTPDANPETNQYGCDPYAPGFSPVKPDGSTGTIAAFVERGGGCSFGTKALNAQAAGADAIVVYTNKVGVQYPLPKMAAGDDTLAIAIPGMLISYADGELLLSHIAKWRTAEAAAESTDPYFKGVWLQFSYELQSPDDRVEWDLYTYPDEVHSAAFLRAYQPVVKALGDKALFTPHFRVMDGDAHACELDDSIECSQASYEAGNFPCGNQCTNCGRYCRLDPNRDVGLPPSGADVVTEITVQRCLYQWSMSNNQPLLWWSYTAARQQLNCVESKNPATCTVDALNLAGVSAEAQQFIRSCQGDTGLFDDDENDVLESELNWQDEWMPLTSPYLFVNNFTYYGGFVCGSPPNVATCGPLSIMCQGYLAGTAPDICNPNGCANGVERDACGVCGGKVTKESECGGGSTSPGDASFPVGAVIGVLILGAVLTGLGVYIYMRRQNSQMRQDIDSLLKQYLPLDGQSGMTGINGDAHKNAVERREPNSNLRLIGNLDSADEPTEL